MSMERAREIHCPAPADNNGGFQRPQSLISSPRYQRFYPPESGEVNSLCSSASEPASWALRVGRGGGGQAVIADGDGRQGGGGGSWGSSDPGSDRGLSEKRLPGHIYQGITNGYDIICLASLPIKAGWGNVALPASTPMSRRALNAALCLRPLISVVIKVPLCRPQREVATGQGY